MKLLIIGIDGGDQRIFENMEMPFLQKLLRENQSIKLEEDLWTRGWSEIFSGKIGTETGAFYTKPILYENEYKLTQSFKSTNYYDNDKITPLWKILNDRNQKVGLMNFPTTAPPPYQLDGFMITGAGSGISQKGIGSAPLKACYPKESKDILDDNEYIFDIRVNNSELRSVSELIENLINMHTKRVDNYIQLFKKYPVDIGGVAFMSTTRIQYLAMYEIENYISDQNYNSDILPLIKKLYSSLDDNLKRLTREINPDEILIVSDHGSEPRKGTINLNQFLKENGWLSLQSHFTQFPKKALNKLNRMAGKKPKYGIPIKREKTKAFTGRYISGMYVNDFKRFQGPVNEHELDNLVDEIVKVFNTYSLAQKHNLEARPYRRHHKGAFKYDLLPDIWVDRPDSLFFEAKGKFVEENHEYGPLGESLEHVTRDQYTGTKGRHPLFICSKGLSEHIKEEDERNLTLAYKVIERYTRNNV